MDDGLVIDCFAGGGGASAGMPAGFRGGAMTKQVLDPCCGHRSFWFDSACPVAVFGDVREGEWELCDGRAFDICPDELIDFTDIPHADGSFGLVVFDPPHLVRAGERSYMAIKYGRLGGGWHNEITQGFAECFRVLRDGGVLVFK